MLLKYCSKRQNFQYNAMKARLMLAALDWNTQTTEVMKDDRLVFSKRRKQWVLKQTYSKKTMQHVPPIMSRTQEIEAQGLSIPAMKRPKNLPKHVASVKQTRQRKCQ